MDSCKTDQDLGNLCHKLIDVVPILVHHGQLNLGRVSVQVLVERRN